MSQSTYSISCSRWWKTDPKATVRPSSLGSKKITRHKSTDMSIPWICIMILWILNNYMKYRYISRNYRNVLNWQRNTDSLIGEFNTLRQGLANLWNMGRLYMAQSAESLCSESGLSKTVVPAESCSQQYLRIAALHWTRELPLAWSAAFSPFDK